MALAISETNIASIFLRFEEFLRKMAKLNLFDTLVYNYRLKQSLPTENILQVARILIELVAFLSDVSQGLQATYDVQSGLETPPISEVVFNHMREEKVIEESGGVDFIVESSGSMSITATSLDELPSEENLLHLDEQCTTNVETENNETEGASANELSNQWNKDVVDDNGTFTNSPEVKFFCCDLCYYSFRSLDSFNLHLYDYSTKETKCYKEGKKGPEFIKENIALQSLRKFICGLCKEEHRSFVSILFHLKHCDGGPFQCELCPTSDPPFETRKSLTLHKITNHKKEKSFICNECGSAFKVKCSLQKHMLRTHERFQGPLKCDCCDEVFEKRILLTNHKLKSHGLDREFLCQQCGSLYSTKATLTTHLKQRHSQIKKYICQFCNKQFVRNDKLQLHLMVHSGERPHVCEYCGKRFSRKTKLTDHIQLHLRSRFKCSVRTCSKAFSACSEMELHLLQKHDCETSSSEMNFTEHVIGGNGIIQSSTEMIRRRKATVCFKEPRPVVYSESTAADFNQENAFRSIDPDKVSELHQIADSNPDLSVVMNATDLEDIPINQAHLAVCQHFGQPSQLIEDESQLNFLNYCTGINIQSNFKLDCSKT